MKKRLDIRISDRYGRLTVIGSPEKDFRGHLLYPVRCDCGNTYSAHSSAIVRNTYGCKDCCVSLRQQDDRNRHLGQSMNGWRILALHGENAHGAPLYKCRCEHCGNISIHTLGQVSLSKTQLCANCRPDYHFTITGNYAVGVLRDGTEFMIDAWAISTVNAHYWIVGKGGYIVCYPSIDGKKGTLFLHRLVMAADDEEIIDHINRNRLDCRSSNLRIVTAQQNSYNKCNYRRSATGYLGVTKGAGKSRYQARIGFDNRMIHLGMTSDPIEAAQLYNEAARLLFGVFAGELNDVPAAPISIVRRAREACAQWLPEAERRTTMLPQRKGLQEAI